MTASNADIRKQIRAVHSRLAVWYYLGVGYVWIAVQAGFLVLLIPRVVENYDGMDTNIPDLTQRLIDISEWMAGESNQSLPGWMIAVPIAVVALTLSAILLRRAVWLLALMPLLAIVALIGQLFLIVAPLYGLTESLTS